MADIVLINPRFEVSFWGLEHALPLLDKRATLPVACLPLLAALTPSEHTVTLIDENVEPIDFARVSRADIVGVTGMSVQRFRMKEILRDLKQRGAFTVVGGPWVTVSEQYFAGLCDAIFVGEADDTWPQFLVDWAQHRHQARYEQDTPTEMTRVPVPRFDLLKMQHYAFGSLQLSRGCPYQCEFCDIIVTFGRRPRLKTSAQLIAEIDALRAQHMLSAFIVDDNFIGNKKAIKPILRDLIAYQEANGYPIGFFTEASLELSEDPALMQLMVEANINCIFVGIESPNEQSLQETKKYQNVRPAAGTILERVRRIQNAGIEIYSGMIVGFDHDDLTIFERQREFIEQSGIANALVGMLMAIPKTPLHARLAKEGRLDPADESEFGTNVIPLHMTRAELRDGWVRLMRGLYQPAAYFARLDDLYIRGHLPVATGMARHWRRHPWTGFKAQLRTLLIAIVFFGRLMSRIADRSLRKEYRHRIWRILKARRSPTLMLNYLIRCAMHYHQHTMVERIATGRSPIVNTL